MYRFFAHIYPKQVKQKFVALLLYAGVKIPAERFMGFMLVFSFLVAVAVGLYGVWLLKISWLVLFLATFLVSQGGIYFLLVLKADSKAKFVEEILPDVLQLMASNLRAGFTSDRALVLAARPEFGPFQDEINRIGREIATGKSVTKALADMGTRIRSERLS